MKKSCSPSASELAERRIALNERASKGEVGIYPGRYAHIVDLYFQERLAAYHGLMNILQVAPLALVAVGGYGRSELCPASDIDVLLLFEKKIPKDAELLSSWLFHPLWDQGLDLGHGVRTFSDCFSLAKGDYQVLASLLDLRFIAGDERVVHAFQQAYAHKVIANKRNGFAAWLEETNRERENAYGDSSGLLEPDLKNGIGGLRGVHQVGWCRQVLASDHKWIDPLTDEERGRLKADYDFLLRTRTALHLKAGRHCDILHFGYQPEVSQLLGYVRAEATPLERGVGVERFLSDLHRAMVRVKSVRAVFWQECFPPRWSRTKQLGMGVLDTPRGLDLESPSASGVMELFLKVAETGRPLSLAATRSIRQILHGPDRLFPSRENLHLLLEAVRAPHGTLAVRRMLETGLLGAILPGLSEVEHLIQFDDYHVHPVGRHTVETVGKLAALMGGEDERFGRIAANVEHPDRVLLAALFHDLGKNKPDHSLSGAELVTDTLEPLGIAASAVADVAFLVQHHLLIPTTATRKDLSDERIAASLAEIAETPDRLDMLYLLSVADSMATGPRAWSEWTGALMWELYGKVRDLLTKGPLSVPDAARHARQVREKARLMASEKHEHVFVSLCLENMPPRAFQALTPENIAYHVDVAAQLKGALEMDSIRMPGKIKGVGVCVLNFRPSGIGNTYELVVAAKDRAGLFATFAGVFALHKLDILAADLFTWKDGTVVDVFIVDAPMDNLFPEEVFERVRRSIHYAFLGKLSLAYRLEEMRKSPLHVQDSGPNLPPVVTIDNESSRFHTLIEVAAPDRLGLLHDIAATLADMYVDIYVAKITTDAGRSADVFYVLASDGRKLDEPGVIKQIKNELFKIVTK